MLNYNHLYYFQVAAEEGSVGAAAARLGVTQPTVSEQIRALERALGLTLFDRHPTGLKLNEQGRLAFERTSVMFRIGDRLVRDLDAKQEASMPTLRVGVSGSVARATTGRFLVPLLAIDCIPVIRILDGSELMRGLRGGQLDLALCDNLPPPADRNDFEISIVERTKLVAVAHPQLAPAPDWRDVALAQYSSASRFRLDTDTFLRDRNLQPRVAVEADDAVFLLEAAASGSYVAIVPLAMARAALTAGVVKQLDELPTEHAAIYAIYRNGVAEGLAKRAVDLISTPV